MNNMVLPSSIRQNAITDASAWEPQDLQPDQTWSVSLTAEQVNDLLSGLNRVKDLHIAEINPANFPIPVCQDVIKQIANELRAGRGFALLHGFPVEGIENEDIARMYWGLCSHLGNGVTQGGDSYNGLIDYVTEGKLRPQTGKRTVGKSGHVGFHNDPADTFMLLCVRQAPDSPKSQLVSSSTIHNALRERMPDKLHRLYEGFPHHHQDLQFAHEAPTSVAPIPVFSQANDLVSSQYNTLRIKLAADLAGGLSAEDTELLDLVDKIAAEFCFSFEFRAGDIQFGNNYVVWHGREAHQPAAEEHRTRLLMRIWLNIDDFRPFADEAVVRYGALKYGERGRSAHDVLKSLDHRIDS